MSDPQQEERDKKVIGLYGEMRLAMELHNRGWQVYRPYIDEKFDFVIMRSYCHKCEQFVNALHRQDRYDGKRRNVVTNLCDLCQKDSLQMLVRFVQVKTSEGIPVNAELKRYSFHPKLRYHLADGRVFYVWIQIWDENTVNYFIFNTSEVAKFDDMSLDTYQVTDNQKTELPILKDGVVLKKGRKYNYLVFEGFRNNFELFDEIIEDEVRLDS
ncbi:MAG: hypothetical protein F4039_05870 [Gammaproteobacteria bacterium]|nr:hypothetical protein [Gammaproteobacteria bacterium]MXX95556.1 hypothetical protein [Gammaproteobacteria bacterium]MYK43595.1 hypothetical protein [Gammaproteobacteria bacterium]